MLLFTIMPKAKTTKAKTAKKATKEAKTSRKVTKVGSAKATKKVESVVTPVPSEEKQEIIAQFQVSQGDTGSPEVQIALLSTRIGKLTDHLKEHGHDVHSRRGLLSMIAKRRRLVNFLVKVDKKRATDITKKVGLKD